jgi:hypothetical protein
MGKPWEKAGKKHENHGKTMKNHGKTNEKSHEHPMVNPLKWQSLEL